MNKTVEWLQTRPTLKFSKCREEQTYISLDNTHIGLLQINRREYRVVWFSDDTMWMGSYGDKKVATQIATILYHLVGYREFDMSDYDDAKSLIRYALVADTLVCYPQHEWSKSIQQTVRSVLTEYVERNGE